MFKIFYGDGTVYEDVDHPELAPKVGVQAILQPNYDKPGFHIQTRTDFYLLRDWYDGPYWQGADRDGKETYERQPGYKVTLRGETIPNDDYMRIYRQADDEMVELNRALRLNG